MSRPSLYCRHPRHTAGQRRLVALSFYCRSIYAILYVPLQRAGERSSGVIAMNLGHVAVWRELSHPITHEIGRKSWRNIAAISRTMGSQRRVLASVTIIRHRAKALKGASHGIGCGRVYSLRGELGVQFRSKQQMRVVGNPLQ